MSRKKCFVVETFNRSTNGLTHTERFSDFDSCASKAYKMACEIGETYGVSRPDDVEFYDAMENGQGWCVGNSVLYVSDITPDEPEYEDFVLLLPREGLCSNADFINGLSYPFKDMEELSGVMGRFLSPAGLSCKVLPRKEFADKVNHGDLCVGVGFDYLIYVKVGL